MGRELDAHYGVSLFDPFKLLLRKNEAVTDLCVKNCSLEEARMRRDLKVN